MNLTGVLLTILTAWRHDVYHYALGAVANFLHTKIAGLTPLEPGYRHFIIQPRPGGTLTFAEAHIIPPNGRAVVSWTLKNNQLKVDFETPCNTSAIVRLGGKEEVLSSGFYQREVTHEPEGKWSPDAYRPVSYG